jgi:hypothetical protein
MCAVRSNRIKSNRVTTETDAIPLRLIRRTDLSRVITVTRALMQVLHGRSEEDSLK